MAIPPIIDFQVVGDSRYIEIGIAALVVSTVLAAITVATTESDVGINEDNLQYILSAPISTAETEVLLLQNYCNRVHFLQTTNRRAIPSLKFAVFCAVAAVILFAVGTYETVRGQLPRTVSIGVIIALVVIGWRLDLHETRKRS
ncbi:MAG: hypothetical protein U5K37_08685 [Natrialbaceae archaeon]|nr:hypothetical protein [Natrialbaceae archaeon]